ncbi:ECF-type sigma factor [Engelhardtia mirabilis]|uniref:ECF sigma factor n=1 Tax=Engelhardtia mirabilis TaxID=2528011 RepID=A0A518BRC5_9BACT|nr:ECF sigma factor [Planctomycetes bacterium Pla133]QDV03858.1 ECF sigma factor [Planctomycetes bacterium Pla86]
MQHKSFMPDFSNEDLLPRMIEKIHEIDQEAFALLWDKLEADLMRMANSKIRRNGAGNVTYSATRLFQDSLFALLGAHLPLVKKLERCGLTIDQILPTDGVEAQDLDREQFLALLSALSEFMRDLLKARADQRKRIKRGGTIHTERIEFALDRPVEASLEDPEVLSSIQEVLETVAKLADPRHIEIFQLHYFAGMPLADLATLYELDERTIRRDIKAVKDALQQQLEA